MMNLLPVGAAFSRDSKPSRSGDRSYENNKSVGLRCAYPDLHHFPNPSFRRQAGIQIQIRDTGVRRYNNKVEDSKMSGFEDSPRPA